MPPQMTPCPVTCRYYRGGAFGERFCMRSYWDERDAAKRPRTGLDYAVIKPVACTERNYGFGRIASAYN